MESRPGDIWAGGQLFELPEDRLGRELVVWATKRFAGDNGESFWICASFGVLGDRT